MNTQSLLKTYKLHPMTFSRLKGSLECQPEIKWGVINYSLTPNDVVFLESAGVEPHTFSMRTKQPKFPFYKFFTYCVFVIPESQFCDEFFSRHIVEYSIKNKNWLLEQRNLFIQTCIPKPLQPTVLKAKPPLKAATKYWNYVRDILQLTEVFENPDLISTFDEVLLTYDTKSLVEVFLATSYTSEREILDVLNKYSGLMWDINEGKIYTELFYNLKDITDKEWQQYTLMLPNKEGHSKLNMRGTTTDKMLIEHGLIWDDKITALLHDAIESFADTYRESKELGTAEGLKNAKEALDVILKAKDRLEIMSGGKSLITEILHEFKIKKEDAYKEYRKMIQEKDDAE